MPIHPFIIVCVLLFTVFFGVVAWTGRISMGWGWVLLDRRTHPREFWVVFFAFLALVAWQSRNLPDMIERVATINAKQKQTISQP